LNQHHLPRTAFCGGTPINKFVFCNLGYDTQKRLELNVLFVKADGINL
jgi:hypothetical protein